MSVVDMNGEPVTYPPEDDELAFTREIADYINESLVLDAKSIVALLDAVKQMQERIADLEKKIKPWWRR